LFKSNSVVFVRDQKNRWLFPEYFSNVQNYQIDVLKNDVTTTAVKQNCLLIDLQYFQTVENDIVDVMHDLYERDCKYDICHILLRFITIEKYFTLENLTFTDIANKTIPF